MKRDFVIVGVLWLVLATIGEFLAIFVDFYPTAMSDKGEEIEDAFRFLVFAAVPVFALVVSVLVYSTLKRGTSEFPGEDGPNIRGRGPLPVAWLGITGGLTLLVMIYPGLVGIPRVFETDTSDSDLIVEVEGVQWAWIVTYPEYDITSVGEIVLPLGRDVTFNITSRDVLHSFWIPSFLMKIDSVPGQVTTVRLRPTETGSFRTNPMLRLQCAELCGLAHSKMVSPVSVVTEDEFDEWISEQTAASPDEPTPSAGAQEVTIVGRNILFDVDEITVESGEQVAITFDNQDPAIPHNWAVYESREAAESGLKPLAGSPIESGPIVQEIVFDPPDPGEYFFRCDVHPTIMIGTLRVR